MKSILLSLAAVLSLAPGPVWANADRAVDLISHPVGYIAIAIFVVAYLLVILEERIHLAKSKPMLIAAGLIWILVALAYRAAGANGEVEEAIRHNFLEYAELFFFLLVAMTYINAMLERGSSTSCGYGCLARALVTGVCSGSPVSWRSVCHRSRTT